MACKLLRVFGYCWLILAVVTIAGGIVTVWAMDGFHAAAALLNPFNIFEWAAVLLVLAPGLAALWWAERIEKRLS